MQILSVGSVTGSGKTTAAIADAAKKSRAGINSAVIMPTRKLLRAAVMDALKDHPHLRGKIKIIISRPGQTDKVTGQISRYLLSVPRDAGIVLFITHEAFMRLRHWHLKEQWHLVVDEVLDTTYCESFTLSEHRHLLLSMLDLVPYDEKYSRIDAKSTEQMEAMAANKDGDAVTELFRTLANKLAPHSHWMLYVDTSQYARFTEGKIKQIEFHGLLHPGIFEGFASVTAMAANLEHSLMYAVSRKLGVTFTPNKAILDGLRYRDHSNGRRLRILYLTERSWSKLVRDLPAILLDETVTVGELYARLIEQTFNDKRYLWIGNTDIPDDELEGTRLPNKPHGLNIYQHFHKCAVLSALRPSPAHGKFLEEMAGIDGRQVSRAILSQVAYQALGRGSLRDPNAPDEFLLIVPDRLTADDVADMYPGCTIARLLDQEVVPEPKKPGPRPSGNAKTSTQRSAECRARKRQVRDWKKRILEDMTRIDVAMADHMQHKFRTKGELRCTPDERGEAYSSPIGAGGFAISRFATYRLSNGDIGYDKIPYETAIYIASEDLVHELRQMQRRQLTAKHHNQLLSPSLYDPKADAEHDRGLLNVYAARGLWFDFEDGELAINELAAIWHDLELVIYPSYRSTPEKPRFRVGIPTTSYMTAEAYNCIIDQLIGRLHAHGYRSKKELDAGARGKHHGVDMSKRHAVALFFFSTLTADPAATFFQHHTGDSRKPLDPKVWLEAAEITLPERMPEDYQRPSQIAPEKLEAVLAEWRMAPRGSGNRAFHRMAWRLLSYGMDVPTIEAVLHNEAQWANSGSRDDRRRQIPYIVSDLIRRGISHGVN